MPDQPAAETSARRVSIIVSAIAVVIAVVHVAAPALTIDWITLTLLAVAVVPWLAPLFKTIEGPGGWKVEFREFRREVTQGLSDNRDRVTALTDRVDKLALAFTGTVSTEQRQSMTGDLERFHAYLTDQEIEVPSELPSVQGVRGMQQRKGAIADYDAAASLIHIDSAFADDTDLLLYTYAEHLLLYPLRGIAGQTEKESMAGGEQAILRAIAHYLVSSFRGNPVSMQKTGARVEGWREINLENERRFGRFDTSGSFSAMYDEMDVWGAVFWTLRARVSGKGTDRLVVTTWTQAHAPGHAKEFRRDFAGSLVSITTESHGRESAEHVKDLLRSRGFKI